MQSRSPIWRRIKPRCWKSPKFLDQPDREAFATPWHIRAAIIRKVSTGKGRDVTVTGHFVANGVLILIVSSPPPSWLPHIEPVPDPFRGSDIRMNSLLVPRTSEGGSARRLSGRNWTAKSRIVLVPASFDEVARSLTAEAAGCRSRKSPCSAGGVLRLIAKAGQGVALLGKSR